MRRVEGDLSQTARATNQPFPMRKPAFGIERFVVETDGQKTSKLVEPSGAIVAEAAKSIDGRDLHSILDRRHITAHVRQCPDLKHGVHVVVRKRQDAAR